MQDRTSHPGKENLMSAAPLKAELTGAFGRAIVSSRTHRFVVDSPPLFNGPNEALNPVEMLLGALATCGIFVCEAVAKEEGIVLQGGSAIVAGEMSSEPATMGLKSAHVTLDLQGVTQEQGQVLAEAFRTRCPIYATIAKAAPIEIEVVVG
jgi:uncharacterized OsmC-like protein